MRFFHYFYYYGIIYQSFFAVSFLCPFSVLCHGHLRGFSAPGLYLFLFTSAANSTTINGDGCAVYGHYVCNSAES